MQIRARIRTAGTIAATAMCVAVATEASAQVQVLNIQDQMGDIFAGQTLNVVTLPNQVTATAIADGVDASVLSEEADVNVLSAQDNQGSVRAENILNVSGEVGPVSLFSRAGGTRLEAAAYGGDLHVEAEQSTGLASVTAEATVNGAPGRLLGGAQVDAVAAANTTALAVSGGVLSGSIDQSAIGYTQALAFGGPEYIPAQAGFIAQATGNLVAATTQAGDIDLEVRQRHTGGPVWAIADANAGNGWDLAGRASATANHASFQNQGGSLVARTDQENTTGVRGVAIVTAYDFGAATSHAQATGNRVEAGNNDIYVKLDNTQLNSGGVEASASFEGHNGYDAYVGADAAGNTVTAYACSVCEPYMTVTNNQVNTGNVTASTVTQITGAGRAVISGVNAVGNSATFYVSRPGG